MGNFPMKRLNRLRKLAQGQNLEDYFRQNLTQNWKAIEDTFTASLREAATQLGLINGLNQSVSSINSEISNLQNSQPQAWISGSSGAFSTSSTTFVDVTNLSITFTNKKPDLLLRLIPDGDSSDEIFSIGAFGSGSQMITRWVLDGSTFFEYANGIMLNTDKKFDLTAYCSATPGNHTIKLQVSTPAGSLIVGNKKILIQELPI